MESGGGVRVKKAEAFASRGRFSLISPNLSPHRIGLRRICPASATFPHSSIGIDPQGRSESLCLSGYITMSRGGALMDLGLAMNMQIIIFSVKLDKFTGFFDKYLKVNGKEIEGVTDIISVGYEDGFKQKMNSFSNFIE